MAKEICISTTPHETRLAILEDDQLAEIYYERENEYTLAGSIYKGRVTRVLPGMQSSFVDVGLERDAFLYVTDFLEEQEDSEDYETATPSRRGGERTSPAEPEAQASEEAPQRRGGRDGRRGDGRRGERTPVQAPQEQVAAFKTAQPTEADREEKGDEETPEGTRRWRGRRGRRRGGVRAGVLSAAQPQAGPEEQEALPQTAATTFSLAEISEEQDEDGPELVDLQAEAAPALLSETMRERPERVDQRERPEPAIPRERSAPAATTLPGEALSKYGGVPSAPVQAAKVSTPMGRPAPVVNYTPPKPKTLVEFIEGWDGGSALPGESLARRKTPAVSAAQTAPYATETEPVPAAQSMSAEAVFVGEQQAAIPASPADDAEPQNEPAIENAIAAATALPAEGEAPETMAEALPGTENAEQGVVAAEPINAEEQTAHAAAEAAGEEPEYEPEDGQASVRLSPPSTQELRLSQFFGGDRAKPVEPEEPATEVPEQSAATEQPRDGDDALRTTLNAGSETAAREEHTAEPTLAAPEAEAVQPVSEEAEVEVFGTPAESPEGEAAVTAEYLAFQQTSAPYSDGIPELIDQLQAFAPGPGLLEEEVIDEDEYDFDPIHAHADEHDLEDLEEETLDGDVYADTVFAREADGEKERNGAPQFTGEPAVVDTLQDEDDEEDEPAAFALEEVDEDEEAVVSADAEPRRQERSGERTGEERGRRGRSGGRRRTIGGNGGGRRQSAQTQDLPIISDLLKQGQEILVQIAKEPIAKKGARITSHIALPGRFLVFMPTVSHVGVSRKIASDEERLRLKRILISEKGDSSGGFIVRTAAEGASEEELRADLRFLISLWSEIKQRAETAKAPALIYHDLNLVERILRDQVSSNFSTIWVDTEQEYERIVRFLNRFQPSLVRRVKLYTKETPLFEHFAIQEEISKALKSKVWLKSGGSIVINQTEALVAIDINTGKYVGKTARLEDTIVKTNLDAIPEIVRQIRLRDLGGIIVIDFIDMDERKNRHRVLAALEEAMKADRAPSKVLQFNDFGLVAITRKRVKQSLERTLSVQCETCAGTGMVKSPITVCNEIYIELRKMQKHLDGKDVMLRVHPEVVKQLKGTNGRWINEYEEMVGKTVIIKSDASLHPEQFDIH